VTGDVPVILRPGLVSREMIERAVGCCEVYEPDLSKGEKVKSPGVLYKHYSPRCETKLFQLEHVGEAIFYLEKKAQEGKRICVLCDDEAAQSVGNFAPVLNLGSTEDEMAARLYALLREAEKICDVMVAIEPKKQDGKMVGVINRLRKACASSDIPH